MIHSDGGRHGQEKASYTVPRRQRGEKAGNRILDGGRSRVSRRSETSCRCESSGQEPPNSEREVRGQDPEGNAVPMQAAGERTLQVSRWPIDRAEDG